MMDDTKKWKFIAENAVAEAIAKRLIGAGIKDERQVKKLSWDLLADFKATGGAVLPVAPNGTVWVIHRRRAMSATVMFVGVGADGLTSFSVLRGRIETTSWASMQFTEHDIGRSVFLTREDALAALEGR